MALTEQQALDVVEAYGLMLTKSASDPKGSPVGFATACRQLGISWPEFREYRATHDHIDRQCDALEDEAKELAADRALGHSLAKGTKAVANGASGAKAPLLQMMADMEESEISAEGNAVDDMMQTIAQEEAK